MAFLVHRRDDLDPDEFSWYWRVYHAEVAQRLPGLKKYAQYPVTPTSGGSQSDYDGIAVMWFDSVDALDEALASDEAVETLSDIKLVTSSLECRFAEGSTRYS
jgi:uncharacterized protein (TIGR02118 family)